MGKLCAPRGFAAAVTLLPVFCLKEVLGRVEERPLLLGEINAPSGARGYR